MATGSRKFRAGKVMKVLKKWFRAGDEAPAEASGAPADHVDDTPVDRRVPELTSSSVFDSPDTHRVRILKSARLRPANDDDNPGYDPYDTGSFDASEKS